MRIHDESGDTARKKAARAILAVLNTAGAGGPAPRIRIVGHTPALFEQAVGHLMEYAHPIACNAHVWEDVLVVTHRTVQPMEDGSEGRFYPWSTAYEKLRESGSADARILLAAPSGALSLGLATLEELRDGYVLDAMPYVASRAPTEEQARQGYVWVLETGSPGISTNDPDDLHLEEPLRSMLFSSWTACAVKVRTHIAT
jgi:hypothetical protein